MIQQKVKAGALQLTLFIVVVIALLLASFLIFVHTYTQYNKQSSFVIETIQHADQGIQYALHNTVPLKDSTFLGLKEENSRSLKVTRDYWGFFEKITSEARIKNYTFKKLALMGASQPHLNRTVLYLEENNKPLVVVGNTRIQGVAHLPVRGVRTGNISGHSYYGSQLVYGSTRPSGQLPNVYSELLDHLKVMSVGEQQNYIDLGKAQEFKNSFFEPLQLVYSPEEIRLEAMSLKGHIFVQSETAIVVHASSQLKDVVLVAPNVEIKDNVEGTFQVIATESITVGEHCRLSYPSALVVYREDGVTTPVEPLRSGDDTKTITIGTATTMEGLVFWDAPLPTKNYEAQILINEQVTISGEVFCKGNLELKGTVYGAVYTSNFVAKQSGSTYQNHIYNGIVNVEELPQEYVGLRFETSKKGVLKWLY